LYFAFVFTSKLKIQYSGFYIFFENTPKIKDFEKTQ